MKRLPRLASILLLSIIVLLGSDVRQAQADRAETSGVIRSIKSGPWSDPKSWQGGHVPEAGDRVLIQEGHEVLYETRSDAVIRGICISGTLKFSTERDTVLNVGLIRIEAGNRYSEDGFDCVHPETSAESGQHHSAPHHQTRKHAAMRPALLMGTPLVPIPSSHTATILLHYVEGMDREHCPAIVCCGGRMEIHGAPLERTWVKLTRTADAGSTRLFLDRVIEDWKVGDRILVTRSGRQFDSLLCERGLH